MRTVRRLHAASSTPTSGRLLLDYDARQKSRFRARLEDGDEIAVHLPRGTVLADGDHLLADDGSSFEVVAAAETLSVASTSDPVLFTRAAYHLGNRHVPLQIRMGCLAFRHDHVLDDLMRRLGLTVGVENAPFTPERGAYDHASSDAHAHSHAHDHAHADHLATEHGLTATASSASAVLRRKPE